MIWKHWLKGGCAGQCFQLCTCNRTKVNNYIQCLFFRLFIFRLVLLDFRERQEKAREQAERERQEREFQEKERIKRERQEWDYKQSQERILQETVDTEAAVDQHFAESLTRLASQQVCVLHIIFIALV